jgi:hypothetical protein
MVPKKTPTRLKYGSKKTQHFSEPSLLKMSLMSKMPIQTVYSAPGSYFFSIPTFPFEWSVRYW